MNAENVGENWKKRVASEGVHLYCRMEPRMPLGLTGLSRVQLFFHSTLNPSDHFRWSDAQSFGQSKDRLQRRVFLPSFQLGDVGSVVVALKTEVFLGQTTLCAQFLQNSTEQPFQTHIFWHEAATASSDIAD